jgi:hypothetical protein
MKARASPVGTFGEPALGRAECSDQKRFLRSRADVNTTNHGARTRSVGVVFSEAAYYKSYAGARVAECPPSLFLLQARTTNRAPATWAGPTNPVETVWPARPAENKGAPPRAPLRLRPALPNRFDYANSAQSSIQRSLGFTAGRYLTHSPPSAIVSVKCGSNGIVGGEIKLSPALHHCRDKSKPHSVPPSHPYTFRMWDSERIMRHLYREIDTYEIEELSQSLKRWDSKVGQHCRRARLCILCVVVWH